MRDREQLADALAQVLAAHGRDPPLRDHVVDRGAEAGTWTDPDFQRRGYAAAVTAAWASLFAPTGRQLFYSTSADNRSSQRVAERLGLHPIGWLWKIAPGAS